MTKQITIHLLDGSCLEVIVTNQMIEGGLPIWNVQDSTIPSQKYLIWRDKIAYISYKE